VTQPFETILQQIDDAVNYAIAGNNPYSAGQVTTNAYSLMYNTGLFNDTCRDWRRFPADQQTYANFQAEFSAAHADLKNQQNTSKGAGYQTNSAMETFCLHTNDSIRHLANAATSDRDSMKAILEANRILLEQVTNLSLEIKKINTNLPRNNQNEKSNPKKRYRNNNYCWTHGYDCHEKHTSATCKNPAEGHQKDATKTNIMSGSTANKNRK
jgi:hypothetical protein